MVSLITQAHFLIKKIQPHMSEQEKKRPRIYDFLNTETKRKQFSEIIGLFFMASIKPEP